MQYRDTKFGKELEIFRTEEQTAQQYFFGYLSIREAAARDEQILRSLNTAPLFWLTAENALLLAAFVALGRIFDQNSRHNIDGLLRIAASDLTLFSRANLARRKRADGIGEADAKKYAADKYEPTATDFREIRREVAIRRRTYDARYRDIRDKVFAHKELSDSNHVNALFGKTNIEEMKEIFAFLHALENALWMLLVNGHKPSINIDNFVTPPAQKLAGQQYKPGEKVAHELATFLSRSK